jgi:argininosuccinate lyase
VIVRETGMSFRMAHNVVALVVRDALAVGRTSDALRSADVDAAAVTLFGKPLGLSAAAVAQALDPAANIAARTVLGGPATLPAMLASRRAALARDAAAVAAVAQRIDAARERCFGLARAF